MAGPTFNIDDFREPDDVDDGAALGRAVEAANAAGGGTVIIPETAVIDSGTYGGVNVQVVEEP